MGRQRGVHLDGRSPRYNGIFGIPGHSNMMIQGCFAEAQTSRSREQSSRHLGASSRLAQNLPSLQSRNTDATRKDEGHNNRLARRQNVNAGTALLDFAAGLMT